MSEIGSTQMLTVAPHYRNQRENINKWDLGGEIWGFSVGLRLILDHSDVKHIPDLINKYSGERILWPECVFSCVACRDKGAGETVMDARNAH